MSAELTCGGKTLKCLVFFFNLLAFIAGVTLLGGCLAARFLDPVTEYLLDNESVKSILEDDVARFRYVLYAGMLVGGVVMVLGFLGCCGAWMENTCMLATFAAVLIILLILQMVVGILIFIHKDKATEHMKTAMGKLVEVVGDDTTAIESKNHACEAFYQLYKNLDCCALGVKDDVRYCTNKNDKLCAEFENVSCIGPMDDLIKDYALLVGIVAVVFMVFEIVAVIFALCLCMSIRKERREEEEED